MNSARSRKGVGRFYIAGVRRRQKGTDDPKGTGIGRYADAGRMEECLAVLLAGCLERQND
ncbi:MAG: hypothetical protein J6B85_03935 [Lachnospiraceae bacterium]|nr:hypothetical protein [Lachnospiraceae bacterium]